MLKIAPPTRKNRTIGACTIAAPRERRGVGLGEAKARERGHLPEQLLGDVLGAVQQDAYREFLRHAR